MLTYLNFTWVIHGKLGGSTGPRSRSDLISLKSRGIGALVRLVEPNESRVTIHDIHEVGLEDYNEPVPDFHAPNREQINKIIAYIDSRLEIGVPVGVSCNAGIGRSGVILACYLVFKGLDAREALSLVREKRGRGPEVPEQIVAVEDYWLRVNSGRRQRTITDSA